MIGLDPRIADQALPKQTHLRQEHQLATKNPTLLHNLRWMIALTQTYPLSTLPPIHITPPLPPRAKQIVICTFTAPLKNHLIASAKVTPHLHSAEPMPLMLADLYRPPALMIIQALLYQVFKLSYGPSQPNNNSPPPKSLPLQAQPGIPPMRSTPGRVLAVTISPQHPMLIHPEQGPEIEEHPFQYDSTPSSQCPPAQLIMQPSETHDSTHQVTPQSNTENDSYAPAAAQGDKRGKKRTLPTRRSQPLQAKQKTTGLISPPLPRNNKKNSELTFHLGSNDTPLDATTTLAILQASGLQITRNVEDAIQEALHQERAKENSEQQRPRTPLHDPIPPLTVPGFELPL